MFLSNGFYEEAGDPGGKMGVYGEVSRIEHFLNDPWLIKSRENATVEILVPKIVVSTLRPPSSLISPVASEKLGIREEGAIVKISSLSPLKNLESGNLVTVLSDADGEEQDPSSSELLCRMCFTGENEGSEGAKKMLSCSSCRRKYHRNCLKRWSQNRDLFHWNSWVCPCCRICEVCKKEGDPSKFVFCKRCDVAYHCYCQKPPHKNVGHWPYLCPKHTKCHSCNSSVPGSGLSSRWFLGYTCCDACGRLFVNGNYCNICLKVYRNSETTPMVCCDTCQCWVHCPCDGISDSKYMEFQTNGDLQYACPTCRGESSKINSLEDAVQKLWRRRDEADRDLISSLRVAAGWSAQETLEILPYSDQEGDGPVANADSGRSLKFSLKGFREKLPRKGKEHGKKSLDRKNVNEAKVSSEHDALSPITGGICDGLGLVNETADAEKDAANDGSNPFRTIKIETHKMAEKIEVDSAKPGSRSGTRLVIHLGGSNPTTSSPPKSEAASVEREQGIGNSFERNPHDSGNGTVALSRHSHQKVNSKLHAEDSTFARGGSVVALNQRNKSSRHAEASGNVDNGSTDVPSVSQASTKTGKPLLKLKIPKNFNNGNETRIVNSGTRDSSPLDCKDKLACTYTRGKDQKEETCIS